MQKWSVSQSMSQKGRESVSQLHSHLGTYLGSQSLSQSFGYSIAQSVSQSVGQWVSKWANESISMSFWVSEWVSAQVSKFKAQFRCHASAMQNLIAIRYDYGPTLCKFSIYWNALGAYFEMKNYFYDSPAVMQSGQITSVWFMNSVWHGRGMTSESLLSQSHEAWQSWLNSILSKVVKKFDSDSVLLLCFCIT